MSADIYAKVDLTHKVRYTKKEQEDITVWEEREVEIYEPADDVADNDTASQPQEEGQQTLRQPKEKGSPAKSAKLCNMLSWVLMLVVIITLTVHFTLEIHELKNNMDLNFKLSEMEVNHSQLHVKLSEMEASYSQLQSIYETLLKNHSELTEEVNRLNTIIGKQCPDGWTRFGSSCYYKGENSKTWEQSREQCQDKGAHLVIINSGAEQEFVEKLNKNGESWIGLQFKWTSSTRTYDWSWVDGSPLTKTFWGPGWPRYTNYQAYAKCCNNQGKWTHTQSYEFKNWICEK